MADKQNPNAIPEPTSGSRSKLLSSNLKNFLSKPAIAHPQKALTVQLYNAEQRSDTKHEQAVNAEPMGKRDEAVGK
ncbi:hypothetical protein HBI56_045040 [Parastagonospora nodorum]|uniref:Uncharacterized protein n=1 Tax=Phaeosphaeria nodorum (strain SN15 / ATCC MYA-4574 / FGSC 10173) TaxID=321614 RepID=A0A7U2EV96_PHANO|nr:hypothetical protein HBH56_058160 [Parastagonospora nodorum]QRC91699.1 hypothetical protein JI435_401550 [Parastagonospora nodorum SN15]KAH3930898.1 hypothetical protein HBH54_102090 [Parastagonospora nodorum]KAH3977589.1 hypothetical protein HBH52_111190 [Parastagonospora nodorum]KAH4121265.1 hypothetical protein HBH47_099050 [Parastagonospora nodorum]